jgi:hypothetical protein
MSPLDISALRTLIATAQKQNDGCTVASEVHAVSWARIDPKLVDAAPDTLPIAKEPNAESIQTRNDAAARKHITQAIEPLSDWRPAVDSLILPNFHSAPV